MVGCGGPLVGGSPAGRIRGEGVLNRLSSRRIIVVIWWVCEGIERGCSC